MTIYAICHIKEINGEYEYNDTFLLYANTYEELDLNYKEICLNYRDIGELSDLGTDFIEYPCGLYARMQGFDIIDKSDYQVLSKYLVTLNIDMVSYNS